MKFHLIFDFIHGEHMIFFHLFIILFRKQRKKLFLKISKYKISVFIYIMRKLGKIIFFLILVSQIYSQCCLRFEGRYCKECPEGTHLFKGNCLFDIKDCAVYKDGFQCGTCNSGFNLNSSGDCVRVQPPAPIVAAQNSEDQNYIEVMINPKKLEGAAGDSFSICDDYLRSVKPELASANFKAGRVKTFKNNNAEITVEYEGAKSALYRAVLQFDLNLFTVKQISFNEVKQSILNKPQATQIKTETINLSNLVHSEKFSQVDVYVKTQNQQIGAFKNGNITTISDGSFNFSLIYLSKNPGWQFYVIASLFKDKSIKLYEIKATPSKIKNDVTIQVTNKDTLEIPKTQSNQQGQTNESTASYRALNAGEYKEENFLICKDIIETQNPQFAGLDPTKVKKSNEGSNCYYIFTFTKADGSIWEIYTQINTDSLVTKIDKITQISSSAIATLTNFKKVPTQLIFQDINFLMAYDYIIKQSNKYKDANIQTVQKYENKNVFSYKINFQCSGALWQVTTNVNLPQFSPSGFVEKKLQISSINKNLTLVDKNQINNKTQPIVNVDKTKNTTSMNNKSNLTQNLSNQIVIPPSPTPPTPPSPSSNSSLPSAVTNFINSSSQNTSKPLQFAESNSSNSNSYTPAANLSGSLLVLTSLTPTLMPPVNVSNQNSINLPNILPNKGQNQAQKSQQGNSKGQNKGNSNGLAMKYEVIRQRMIGMNQLSKNQQVGVEFREIDKVVRNSNQAELKNAQVIGVFTKTAGFITTYQIFYAGQSSDTILEITATRDFLRKKTYIIGFNKSGY